ncbi:MAG: FecR domain-containing protein [Spirochaetota bacterium]|nr:MAG: FecR domain-containing protein [Spirochaetota bacterium]
MKIRIGAGLGLRLGVGLRLMSLVLFFSFIVLPIPLQGAVVDWVSGEVSYSHYRGEWKDVDIGMDLNAGDIIKTGMQSEAVLLEDGGEIHILENSEFTVSERYEEEQKRSTLMLFLGRMKFKIGKSTGKEPEIRTQTVNLAIRGTDFEVGSGYDGSTIVLLSDGSVAVQGKTEELVLDEGEGTEVLFGEEPREKFKVMERVIDWDEWFAYSEEAIEGNELNLLEKMLERFVELQAEIRDNETIRENALEEKEALIAKRDELYDAGKEEEATEYSIKAGNKSKRAIHALVNIRFLALSSIGLYDMAERIYTGIEEPSKEIVDVFAEIKEIYRWIEEKYIMAGDRERLEEKADQKRGCLTLF